MRNLTKFNRVGRSKYTALFAGIICFLSPLTGVAETTAVSKTETQSQAVASSKQQAQVVTGKVTDESGEPIPGVTVSVKDTKEVVTTNLEGEFSISLPAGKDILVCKCIGMRTEEIQAVPGKPLNIQLNCENTMLSEAVVTGYQTFSRRESASAISTAKLDDIYMAGAMSVDQMLQGQLPGIAVMNVSGEPSGTPRIRIRGTSTINGNKAPVWVVDGVILEQDVPISASELNSDDAEYLIGNAISGISPQDIESITVLKDASATAIYGVKAANGVIVLTTKKGRIGRPTISYHGEVVVTDRPSYRNYDRMNASERMLLSKETFESGLSYPSVGTMNLNRGDSYEGLINSLINREITRQEFDDEALQMAKRNTDWYDVLFRNAVTQNHNVNISGGTETAKYYFSVGYNDNKGSAKGSESRRFTSLGKVDVNYNKYLNFSLKIDYSTITNDGYNVVNPFTYAYNAARTLTPYNADGSYHMYQYSNNRLYNVLHELDNTGKSVTNNDFNALLNLNINIFRGFKYQGVFSYHNSTSNSRDWKKAESNAVAVMRGYEYNQFDENDTDYWESPLPYGGVLNQGFMHKTGYTVRNAVNYNNSFNGIHDVNVYGGFEIRGTKYKGTSVTGYGWTPEFGEQFNPIYTTSFTNQYAASGRLLPTNTNTMSRVASFFGTASYTFDNRYVLNGNIRSDGANKFGSNPKYRWQPTWSIAGKWELTNEMFMRDIAEMGNYIALRGSYGVQGNIHDDATPNLILQIGNRDPLSNLQTSTIYRLPNPDLRWEKTRSWNAALDFSVLNSRISGSFDVYRKHTTDLIMDKTVASSTGRARLFMNAGVMDNYGYEGNLSVGVIRSHLVDWNINVNFGHNTNKVKLANDDFYSTSEEISLMLNGNIPVEGEKLGMMYSFDYAGLGDDGYPLFRGKDGKLYHDGDPRMFELVKSGSINPDLTGGFDTQLTFWKRLSLSVGFTFSIGGVKRLPAIYSNTGRAMNPMTNVSTDWSNRWRRPGDENVTDIPILYNSKDAEKFSSRGLRMWNPEDPYSLEYCTYFYDRSSVRVADADFLRLRLIGLTYRVPEKYLKKIGISSLMLRAQATNVHVWASKKWKGLDPETPEANVPVLPAYSFGLNVSF